MWQRWPPPDGVEGWIWTLRRIGRPGIDPERYDRARPMFVSMQEGSSILHLPEGQIVPLERVIFDFWAPLQEHPPPAPATELGGEEP